jgi:hypothetical protein
VNAKELELALQELGRRTEEIRPSDVGFFSEPLRSVLNNAVRTGRISLTEFAASLELERGDARRLVDLLVARRLFQVASASNEHETFYETRISAFTARWKKPRIDIWKKIDD